MGRDGGGGACQGVLELLYGAGGWRLVGVWGFGGEKDIRKNGSEGRVGWS